MPFGLKLHPSSPGSSKSHHSSTHRHHYFDWSSNGSFRQSDRMKIILEDNDILHVGQSIRGTVIIDLVSDIPLTECKIKMLGFAKVSWQENPGLKEEGRQYNVQRRVLEILYPLEDCKYTRSVVSVSNCFAFHSHHHRIHPGRSSRDSVRIRRTGRSRTTVIVSKPLWYDQLWNRGQLW